MLSLTKSTELPRETVYFDGVFNLLLQFTFLFEYALLFYTFVVTLYSLPQHLL